MNDYGACLLGSINLERMVINAYSDNAEFDMELFIQTVHDGVRYLNDILDDNADSHPLVEQRVNAKQFRPIGLGIMGLHDMLLQLGIKYGSKESIELSKMISYVMLNEALRASATIASNDKPFPKWKDSIADSAWLLERCEPDVLELIKKYGLRNAQLLTIAPTGTLSTMLDVSGGIEPFFATSLVRKTESIGDGDEYFSVQKKTVRAFLDANEDKSESDIITAQELDYVQRIEMQSAWQNNIDNAISSTINLVESATVEDVKKIYELGYKHNLKGLTVFRDNCGRSQILTVAKKEQIKENEIECST